MSRISYRCPVTREVLSHRLDGLARSDGTVYRFLEGTPDGLPPIPDFLATDASGKALLPGADLYGATDSPEVYRNFLDWLFATFNESEAQWRAKMATRLRLLPGDVVLVTGCGLGDDIPPLLDAVGPGGEIHAQDRATPMIRGAAEKWAQQRRDALDRLNFSVGDALHLPYGDSTFDAAYHFGGINLFADVRAGIAEMSRVVRPGGRVVVGDEGVAPWLRDTDYGRMVVTNNALWGLAAPIDLLPSTAADVTLEWVLGECFWVIGFSVGNEPPFINPHVPHKGRRGGTMWTRHRGQLEAVTPETRALVQQAAAATGLSVHDWLEQTLRERLQADQSTSSTASPNPVRP